MKTNLLKKSSISSIESAFPDNKKSLQKWYQGIVGNLLDADEFGLTASGLLYRHEQWKSQKPFGMRNPIQTKIELTLSPRERVEKIDYLGEKNNLKQEVQALQREMNIRGISFVEKEKLKRVIELHQYFSQEILDMVQEALEIETPLQERIDAFYQILYGENSIEKDKE